MYNEKSFLAIAAIPNTIWKKFKIRLSPMGNFIWIGDPATFHIESNSVIRSSDLIDSFHLSMDHSFIVFSLKDKTMHTYING
jgi:hypothetical protein